MSVGRDRVVLLFRMMLGAVGIPLDPSRFLAICPAVTWWFILGNHQDLAKDGT
jgi:hypothetical protein